MISLPEPLRSRGEQACQAFLTGLEDELLPTPLDARQQEVMTRVFALSEFAEATARRQKPWLLEVLLDGRLDLAFTRADLEQLYMKAY